MKLYFDTSVLVASAVKGHVHHAPAHSALERLLRDKHRGYVSAHGLAEIYAVLTRAPFVPPVYPSEAWQILEQNILPHFTLVELASKRLRRARKSVRGTGVDGRAGLRLAPLSVRSEGELRADLHVQPSALPGTGSGKFGAKDPRPLSCRFKLL